MGRKARTLTVFRPYWPVLLGLVIAFSFLYFKNPAPPKLFVMVPAPIALTSLGQSRVIYPYSVIPGGVRSPEELRTAMSDPVVALHYAGIQTGSMRMVKLVRNEPAYVSFRVHDRIFWTAQKITLRKDELLLTNGAETVRSRCGNQVSKTPRQPAREAPAMDEPERFASQGESDRSIGPGVAKSTTPSSGVAATTVRQGDSDRAISPARSSVSSTSAPIPGPFGRSPLSGIFLIPGTSTGVTSSPSTPSTVPPTLNLTPIPPQAYIFVSFPGFPPLTNLSAYTGAEQIFAPSTPVLYLPVSLCPFCTPQVGSSAVPNQPGLLQVSYLPSINFVSLPETAPVFTESLPLTTDLAPSTLPTFAEQTNDHTNTPEPSTVSVFMLGLSALICGGRFLRRPGRSPVV